MLTSGLFTSTTDLWATPQDLFDRLNAKYQFTLDVCAIPENAKCERFFTPEIDGLSQEWGGERCFCNPPYGREIGKWIEKAYNSNTLVVMLLPARTDTKWFHDYCIKGDITFLRGRLKFGNSKNYAPFPSMIVVFNKENYNGQKDNK